MLVSGCGGDSVRVDWVQWFSFRSIGGMTVAPDGAVTVVGRDNAAVFGLGSPTPRQPFIARIDADGELAWQHVDVLGRRTDLVVAESGTTYHAVWRPIALDDPEAAPFAESTADCFVEARDDDGNALWTWRTQAEGSGACASPRGIAHATLVVTAGSMVYGVSSAGETVWQTEIAALDGQERWAAGGGHVWGVDEGYSETSVAVRIDPRDGTHEALERDAGWTVAAVDASEDGLLLLEIEQLPHSDVQRLVQLDAQGEVRWSRLLPPWEVPDMASGAAVVHAGSGPWIVGSESIAPELPEADPGEGEDAGEADPEVDLAIPTQHRVVLQRHDPRGRLEHRVRRTFAEDPDAPRDRRRCIGTDVAMHDDDGSRASFAAWAPDGALVVAGRQGCRDGFVMRVEVQR